ncbi:histone H1-like, partial [Seriola lalandi dorsalis]
MSRKVKKSGSELETVRVCQRGLKPPAVKPQSPRVHTGAARDGDTLSSARPPHLCPHTFISRLFDGQNVEEKTQVAPRLSGRAPSLSTVLMAVISPASCSEPGHLQRDTAHRDTHMAEEAPAAAPAKAPAKAPKKKSAPRPKKEGPSLPKLIVSAVAESKERKGMSLAALKKALAARGVDVTKTNKRVNTAVTKLVTKGTLVQTKGTGASGSFKLAKSEPKAAKPAKAVLKKKPAVKAKKPAAKKAPAKKPAAAKKAAVKKSPKKAPAKKPAKKLPKKSPKKSPKK